MNLQLNDNPANLNTETIDIPLLGGSITFPAELMRYSKLRNFYYAMSNKAKIEFLVKYKTFSGLDDFIDHGFDTGMAIIDKAMDEAINIAVKNKIYDLNKKLFIEKYYQPYFVWPEAFDNLCDQYESIIDDEAQKDEYRTRRRESRSRFVGYGYGVSGAIKASAQAGALNLATGAAHGIFNLGAKAISAVGAGIKKSGIFHSEETKEMLTEAIGMSVFNIHFALCEALSENLGIDFTEITDEHIEKTNILLSNLSRVSDENEKKDILIQALVNNPFCETVYEKLLEMIEPKDYSSIITLANYFSVDIKSLLIPVINNICSCVQSNDMKANVKARKQCLELKEMAHIGQNDAFDEVEENIEEAFIDEIDNFSLTTEKSIDDLKAFVAKRAKECFIDENSDLYKNINSELSSKIDEFLLSLRSIDGIVFTNKKEKEVAQGIYNELKKILDALKCSKTLDEYNQNHEKLTTELSKCKFPQLVQHFNSRVEELANLQNEIVCEKVLEGFDNYDANQCDEKIKEISQLNIQNEIKEKFITKLINKARAPYKSELDLLCKDLSSKSKDEIRKIGQEITAKNLPRIVTENYLIEIDNELNKTVFDDVSSLVKKAFNAKLTSNASPNTSKNSKSLVVALLLCFFLGFLGVHRFYLGRIGTGIIMLVLSLSGMGFFISGIWILIDLILIATGKLKPADGSDLAKN